MMFPQVLATEFMKLRRSKVTWATFVVFAIAPLGLALFMWIVREPDRAAQLGLLGTKANLAGIEATWPAYFATMTMVVGVGGMLLLAFIVAYVFGREYAEATAKNLLALPCSRDLFVYAKLTVAAVWWVALTISVVLESLAIGLALDLPGFSTGLAVHALGNALTAAAISFLFVPVVAWITTLGRGYMPPLAFAIVMLALGDLFSHTGWSVWFPWAIVPSLIGMVGQPASGLPAGSYVVLAVTFIGGVAATIAQLRYADCSQ
jgi:ABC-type transport system involved in multi-copper enzyme maturation permease subunit